MGFRTGSYAKVWSIEPRNDTHTTCRISISRKNKKTDLYEQDFSGFVDFAGTAAAQKAARLREGDSIRLGDVDVTTFYDVEKKVQYTNYKVFSFDLANRSNTVQQGNVIRPTLRSVEPQPIVDDGELESPW